MANIDSTPWERPSVSDVLEVKEILLKVSRLPIEIVEEIVDFAEYWPYTTTTCGVKLARGGVNEDVLILSSLPLGYSPEDMQKQKYTLPQHEYSEWHRNTRLSLNIPKPAPIPSSPVTNEVLDEWKCQAKPRGKYACRKIVFTIKSRDQGWGGDRSPEDSPYHGSYTWFDVGKGRTKAIQVKGNGEKDPSASTYTWRDHGTGLQRQLRIMPPPVSSSSEWFGVGEGSIYSDHSDLICQLGRVPSETWLVYDPVEPVQQDHVPGNPKWQHPPLPGANKIQSNVTALGQDTTHIVTWTASDCIQADSEEANELDAKGRGAATANGEFVRSLEFGDVVTVWARARFPGWANKVESAKVDLYWAV